MRRSSAISALAKERVAAYFDPWDTLPQRRAHIWKDTIDGTRNTGNAAG